MNPATGINADKTEFKKVYLSLFLLINEKLSKSGKVRKKSQLDETKNQLKKTLLKLITLE